MKYIIAIGFGLLLAVALRSEEPKPAVHVVSEKTQTLIWKAQAKINALNTQIEQTKAAKDRALEMEALQKALQQGNKDCGDGWHIEQDAKEDLVCAVNKEK